MQGFEIGNGQMPKERKKKCFFHFPLKLYSLSQADNVLNFIYSPNKSRKTPSHTNQLKQLAFWGFICHEDLL